MSFNLCLFDSHNVHPELVCTDEIDEDFEDDRLPTLVTKLWLQNYMVKYLYYERPMSSKVVIYKISALYENTKMSSLTQNRVRRMRISSHRGQIHPYD